MKKKFFFFTFAFIFIFFHLLFFLLIFKEKQAKGKTAGIKSFFQESQTSVFIGEHRFTLYGYTSPSALVTFSGLGIFDQTIADEKGYFMFKNRFSPFSPREACLTAQDQFGRLTSPLCLPPFPTDYNIEIGPVIMPPTLSLDKNNYWVGDEIILTGQTVPNSSIKLFFFSQKSSDIINNFLAKFFLFSKVFAQETKSLPTLADDKGNFSIKLNTSKAQKIRFFTQINFEKKTSEASRKLTVEILPWWMIIFKFFSLIFSLIKSRLLEFIIIGQIITLFLYFLKKYFHPKTLSIVKWENKLPMVRNN